MLLKLPNLHKECDLPVKSRCPAVIDESGSCLVFSWSLLNILNIFSFKYLNEADNLTMWYENI